MVAHPLVEFTLFQILLVLILAVAVTIHLAKRRRRNELTSLPDDDPNVADQAYSGGWRIDEDGWWWRQLRKTDITFQRADGFTSGDGVYVKTAQNAIDYDLGILPDSEEDW